MIIYSLAHADSVLEASLIRAMKKGGGKLNPCTITLHGPPGVGKTSLKRVILGEPPLAMEKQNSTNIMEKAARAISTKRFKANRGQLLMEVNNEELIKMLARKVNSIPRRLGDHTKPVSIVCHIMYAHLNLNFILPIKVSLVTIV